MFSSSHRHLQCALYSGSSDVERHQQTCGCRWQEKEYILKTLGHRTVPIEVGPHYLHPSWHQRLLPFSEFWEASFGSASGPTSDGVDAAVCHCDGGRDLEVPVRTRCGSCDPSCNPSPQWPAGADRTDVGVMGKAECGMCECAAAAAAEHESGSIDAATLGARRCAAAAIQNDAETHWEPLGDGGTSSDAGMPGCAAAGSNDGFVAASRENERGMVDAAKHVVCRCAASAEEGANTMNRAAPLRKGECVSTCAAACAGGGLGSLPGIASAAADREARMVAQGSGAGREESKMYLAQHELFEQVPALRRDIMVRCFCALPPCMQ
jgi:hypothetical protein